MSNDTLHLAVELLLPSAFAAIVMLTLWRSWPSASDPRLQRKHTWWIFVLLRVALPVAVFGVGGVAIDEWGTDADFWAESTDQQLRGGVPGKDFFNPYGPLLPYAQTLGRWIVPGRHWLGALFPFVIGDALAIHFGARLAREFGDARAAAWVGAWLLLTPLTWHLLALRGQDEQLLVGTLLLAAWFVHLDRPVRAGVALALGLALTKATYGIHASAILLAVPLAGGRALRAWGSFSATVIVVYGLYVATGADLFVPGDLQDVLNNYGIGLSVPDLLRRHAVPLPIEVAAAAYVVIVAATTAVIARRSRTRPPGERAILVSAAVQSVTMIAAPMCVAPYVTVGLPFVLLVLVLSPRDSRLRTLAAALFALLGLLVPLLWVFPAQVMEPLAATSVLAHAALLVLVWRRAGQTLNSITNARTPAG